MKKICIICFIFLFTSLFVKIGTSYAKKDKNIGFVRVSRGDVKIIRATKEVPVKKNMQLFINDEITTMENSILTMYMKDGSIFTIPEKSQLVLERYDVSNDKTKRNASLKLIFGKIRGAAKTIESKEPNILVKTPSAVAGIRGTDIFIEVGNEKTDKKGDITTKISCLAGTCLGGSIVLKKESSAIKNIFSIIRTAHAEKKSVELVQIPKGSVVSVKRDMTLENILKTSRIIPENTRMAISNHTPTSDKEHSEAITNNALTIDATSEKHTQSDIDSKLSKEEFITKIDTAETITELKPAEIKKIIGKTRLTIYVNIDSH